MPEATGKARDFLLNLDNDSKDSSTLHGIRQEASLLNAGVATIALWLWGVLQSITALVPIVLLIWLQVLPSKVTVMDKAEEARQSGQMVAELEHLAIGTLDAQLYDTLETIDILKTALNSELAHNEDTTTTNHAALARFLLGS
jgi:predicted transglutaminase-like protease